MKTRRWRVLPVASPSQLASLATSVEGNLLLAQLLHNRGLVDPEHSQLFLSAGEALSHDPFLINDMDRAVERVIHALVADELIAVYGDYDVDGITGTVLLTEVLSHLGGRYRPYIPHRYNEGYGLNRSALDLLANEGAKLVLAVDCGTNALEEARYARSLGLDLIIADHHTFGTELPEPVVLLNPKRQDSTYPFRHLASVGVAFKFAQALLRSCRWNDGRSAIRDGGIRRDGVNQPSAGVRPLQEDDLLDLVALGTIADLVPLVGENRYLVKRGLAAINSTNRVGIQQMLQRAGLRPGTVGSGTIGFVLGPRLNAAGRLGDATASYELLSAKDVDEARRLAEFLDEKNVERQRVTAEAVLVATEEVGPIADRSPILVSCNRSYLPGILGLVAGRLVEQFYKPAVVIEQGEEDCRGSARSIPEFNMVEALCKCEDLLVRFGGHSQAAGFTVRRANIGRLQDRLISLADSALGGAELCPSLRIDAEVPLSSFDGRSIGLLNRFGPFGLGNPVPTFLSTGVRILERRAVGSQGNHLKLRLSDGRNAWSAIGFGLGDKLDGLSSYIDVVYSLEETFWNGDWHVQMRVNDLRPTKE